ncbi:MAG: PD40 domain-containing protein, partial [Deltaproteobacteria bacterium]|nr:PD40 domain-containing protein [Deltaproteobacteria bacterium]
MRWIYKRRAFEWLSVVLVGFCAACGTGPRPVLREYLPLAPRAELGRATTLAASSSDELAGELSADGRQLLYASDQKGQLDIWRKNLTTGEVVRITDDPAVDTQPSWSRDGKSLVFVSMRKDAKGDLYRWAGGKVERLTDGEALEAFPRFGPDGALYYARGAVGRTRIERRLPGAKTGEPLTRWGATHPAISADGRYLAFTWTDNDQRARVVLKRLADNKTWLVSTADYGAGFPTFSPDGAHLAFVRFYRGAPFAPREPGAKSSLWRVALAKVVSGLSSKELMGNAEQLSSDRGSVLLARWHRRGIVFTTRRAGSLDVGIVPSGGIVPHLRDGAAQLALAMNQHDVWDRLLCLRALTASRVKSGADVRARALYRSARLLVEQAQFSKAEQALGGMIALGSAPYASLARLDLFVLPVAREAEARRRGRKHRWREALRGALAQLAKPLPASAPSPRARAHHAGHDTPRQIVARATFRLGELYLRAKSPELLARYYLTLFSRFPHQAQLLRRAADAALTPFSALAPKEQIERLRALVDQHPDKRLFVARAERRLARLYQDLGALDLAVAAMARVADLEGAAGDAAFALGRLSLRYSAQLRQQGRASEAMGFYARALTAYEKILKEHEEASEPHARAKREYTRLALLEASQLRSRGDLGAAEKRYKRLLAFDDSVLAAHRELIGVAAARGKLEALRQSYERRLSKDAGDFVATYIVGYLATLGEPDAGDMKQARKLLERARSMRPQSAFPHLTLGWIFEMRERYLGEANRGWLEEAISSYERAYALNDATIDPQTESDLLVNLSNTFVALGGDWKRVHQYCARRVKLGYPLRSPAQEASQLLSCGRASSAVGRYGEARDRFERGLELGGRLSLPRLQAELVARLGLNEHLRGDYAAADVLLRRALTRLTALGQDRALSGLRRTVAYNLVVAGRKNAALKALGKAEAQLQATGAPVIGDFISVGAAAADPSTAPFGYGAQAEQGVQLAIREISLENEGRQREALA